MGGGRAGRRGASLRIVYALDEAEALVRERASGVAVSAQLVPGGPSRALIEAAKDATMLVVGGHGAGTLTGLLLGSVAFPRPRRFPGTRSRFGKPRPAAPCSLPRSDRALDPTHTPAVIMQLFADSLHDHD
jgi:hypothetical protein